MRLLSDNKTCKQGKEKNQLEKSSCLILIIRGTFQPLLSSLTPMIVIFYHHFHHRQESNLKPFCTIRSHGRKKPCWMANEAEGQEKQRDYIIQNTKILSFQGSIASFRAIQQGVVSTI